MTFPLRGADGSFRPFLTRIIPLKNRDGSVSQWFGTNTDVEKLARAEAEIRLLNAGLEERVQLRTSELQTANQEMEAFCYSVSHDLRAPLRGIDGFSQALLEDYADKLDDTGRHYLQRIRGGCQRMGQLIDDLLKLSQLSRSEMQRRRIDLSALARQVAHELRGTAPERVVQFHIAEGLESVGDPGMLRVVLWNLLENAWKFTGKVAEAVIEFGVKRQDGPAIFFVRDNGAGI